MKKLAVLIGLFVLWGAGTAEAVPQTISFTGRLTTSTGPVTGSVNLTFKLFDDPTGGTAVWTEVRNGVGANSTGLVFVDLGQVTTLDSSLFTGATMYLEITVGSETLSPRLAINSVPYAMHTADSDTLGGTIGAGDVITSAAGTGGVTATKTGNALSVSLTTTGCNNGQVYKYNGTTFACANDADSPPTAGAGIAVSGNTVSLSTSGCNAGYVWKYSGSAWACAPDADTNTTYSAGAGIAISGTTVGLSTTGCSAGYVWKYNGTTWACAKDADSGGTITSVSAGAGLTGGGTSGAVSLSVDASTVQTRVTGACAVGSAIRSISSTGAVVCQPDQHGVAGAQQTSFTGTAISSTTAVELATVTVPGSPAGATIFDAHVYVEKPVTTTGRYEFAFRVGSCSGALIGITMWRPLTGTSGLDATTISLTGTANLTGASTIVLCGRLFDSGAPAASVYARGITASW